MLFHLLVLQPNQILIEHVISKLQEHQMLQLRLHRQLGYSAVKMHLNQALKAQSKLQIEQLHLSVQTIQGNCLHIVRIALVSF